MDEREYAAATQEQRDAFDDMCRREAEAEAFAERYNEYKLEGVLLGPDPDEEFERFLESLEVA